MAGQMHRRNTLRVPLYQRIRDSPTPIPEPAPPRPEPSSIRHCWVTDEHGGQPVLVLEWWRQTASGWQGQVVRPVVKDRYWTVVEEWLASRLLSATE